MSDLNEIIGFIEKCIKYAKKHKSAECSIPYETLVSIRDHLASYVILHMLHEQLRQCYDILKDNYSILRDNYDILKENIELEKEIEELENLNKQ